MGVGASLNKMVSVGLLDETTLEFRLEGEERVSCADI